MRVIESFIRGKYADQSLCEDGIVIGTGIAAVIDGVTSHGKLRWNGGTGGRFAKDVLCAYILAHEAELARLPAGECMRRLNRALAEKCEAVRPGKPAIEEYPRACIILYNSTAGEVWSYGDCHCRIGEEVHSEGKEADRLLSELRSFVIRSGVIERLAAGAEQIGGASPEQALSGGSSSEHIAEKLLTLFDGHDIGREAIIPLIERQLWFENMPGPFGYPVLNGRRIAEDMVKIWPVPDGAEVILATDGYPVPGTTLAESEERLRELIAEDPLCIGRNAGTKGIMDGMESFDDRAYIRIKTRSEAT